MMPRLIHLDYDPSQPTRRPSTWRNVPVEDGGYRFDSKAEHRRWQQLVLLQQAGAITDLIVHPPFRLTVNGQVICTYIADFAYYEGTNRVVEDVKGRVTPVFSIKSRLMHACLGIRVREVRDP
jgi:hypothetical protein